MKAVFTLFLSLMGSTALAGLLFLTPIKGLQVKTPPLIKTDLLDWFRTDKINFISGNPVTWTDQGLNGASGLMNWGGGHLPTLVPNAINGKPTLAYGNAVIGTWSNTPSPVVPKFVPGTASCYFGVWKSNTFANTGSEYAELLTLNTGLSPSPAFEMFLLNNAAGLGFDTYPMLTWAILDGTMQYIGAQTLPNYDSYNWWMLSYNGGTYSSIPSWTLYLNSATPTTITMATAAASTTLYEVNQHIFGQGPIQGNWGEFGYYGSACSGTHASEMAAYMTYYWAI